MEVAEVVPGEPPRILATDREVTRLGESVFRNGILSQEAIDASCAVLARMAEQIRKLDVAGMRVVATSAVRDTRNPSAFLQRASQAIGAPVETISGREEARLVQMGLQNRWPQNGKRILILDIGGGSAEIISSEDGRMRDAFSKPLGAVRLREIFLKSDPPAPRELHQMDEYIGEKLASAVRRFGRSRWERAIATAATASAVVSAVNRVPRVKRETADRLRAATPEVRKLLRKLAPLDIAGRRKITGIGPRRAEIIVPGTAVLLHFLEGFGFPFFYYSAAGVRDGIIADLAQRGVGNELARLSREQRHEVEQMCRRYGTPVEHGRKVADLAHALFLGLQSLHGLGAKYGKLLEAAAYLHDIGHYVSDLSHHKHSYYLVANSDMPGFTNRERELIANLCRYHRKALPAPYHDNYQPLSAEEKKALGLLMPLLRLADNLDRSHEQRIEAMDCQVQNGQVVIRLSASLDIDLEQWAAERTAELFRQVYNVPVVLSRVAA